MRTPAGIYINWSAYDELSDKVELTEEIAMKQLGELVRLRKLGVNMEYYMMDCFWYGKDSAYRSFRKPHWPSGPDRWLGECLEKGIKPGLWLATNNCSEFCGLSCPEVWKSSLSPLKEALAFADGDFTGHLFETLDMWYRRGVRMYKWDFAALDAATPKMLRNMLPEEIREANIQALRGAMLEYRRAHPDCLHIAYNGFEVGGVQAGTGGPLRKAIDTRWLDLFDSMYCGDPRPADVPAKNFWRSKDVYSDHLVKVYECSSYPLGRIDNAGFMIGTTGTCYYRGKAAWKGMLVLSLARGGAMNTYYGNLDLLDEADAKWFAKAQEMFWPALIADTVRTTGGLPGREEVYGYEAAFGRDRLITWVNPSQGEVEIDVPAGARVLFADDRLPVIAGNKLTLGAEQMVLLGTGEYASAEYDLGVEGDVKIPKRITPVAAEFVQTGKEAAGKVTAMFTGTLRVVMKQTEGKGTIRLPKRISGGSAPKGMLLGKMLTIDVTRQVDGAAVTVEKDYDKIIWSGLSWAVGEVQVTAGDVLKVRVGTTVENVQMEVTVYRVE